MALYTLGLNHQTAPLDVRERVAFAPDALGRRAARPPRRGRKVKEAAILSTCNRTEVYVHGARAAAGRRTGSRSSTTCRKRYAVAVRLHAAAGTGGHARVPRRERPRLDGAGRAADPRPDEAGGAPRRVGRLAGPRAQPPVPAHVRRREGRAHADRHRQRVDLDGRGGGEARRAHLPVDRRAAAAADRRRRDDRAHRDALRRAATRSRSPSPTARSSAGSQLAERLRRRGDHAERDARRGCREFDIIVTCTASTLPILGKGLLERVVKARRHAPIFIVDLAVPRDVEPEAGGARRRVPLHASTTCRTSSRTTCRSARRRWCRPRQMIADADRAASCAGSRAARWCRRSRRCTATTSSCARPSSSARGACSRAARRPSRCSSALARGLTNKFLHAPTQALNQAGDAERAELVALFQRDLPAAPTPGISGRGPARVRRALPRRCPRSSTAPRRSRSRRAAVAAQQSGLTR